MGARLTYRDESGAERTVELSGARVTVGRGADCDIRSGLAKTSRTHCELVSERGRWVVRDLDSKTGTFVGNERVKERKLAPGDIIRCGALLVTFHDAPARPPPSPADTRSKKERDAEKAHLGSVEGDLEQCKITVEQLRAKILDLQAERSRLIDECSQQRKLRVDECEKNLELAEKLRLANMAKERLTTEVAHLKNLLQLAEQRAEVPTKYVPDDKSAAAREAALVDVINGQKRTIEEKHAGLMNMQLEHDHLRAEHEKLVAATETQSRELRYERDKLKTQLGQCRESAKKDESRIDALDAQLATAEQQAKALRDELKLLRAKS
jgi:pSer/pThr/pTyr-binding forkhead associated (FHA) protein